MIDKKYTSKIVLWETNKGLKNRLKFVSDTQGQFRLERGRKLKNKGVSSHIGIFIVFLIFCYQTFLVDNKPDIFIRKVSKKHSKTGGHFS